MKTNERGITLVELLGVLAIMSVVILLIGSVHLFGQKQLVYQTDQVNKQGDARQVISQLTTDFRSVTADQYIVEDDEYQIGDYVYRFDDATIYRNDQIISDDIVSFDLSPILDEEELVGVNIVIESLASEQGSQTPVKSAIYFRR